MPRCRRGLAAAVLVAGALATRPADAQTPSSAALFDAAVAQAEVSLREGERELAESRYRAAAERGWLLLGAMAMADGRTADARTAFGRAATATPDETGGTMALSAVDLEAGKPGAAVSALTALASSHPRSIPIRRLLAQALVADGRPAEAVQELEEVHGGSPGDIELTFVLASGYLRLGNLEKAASLFDQVRAAHPEAATDVLIARMYRDAGQQERAAALLRGALARDPRVRHAHYYLATLAVMARGTDGLPAAVDEFRRELAIAPDDRIATLRLGMALTDLRRSAEAIDVLAPLVRSPAAPADAYLYLGRSHLALGHAADAAAALRAALARSEGANLDPARVASIHYQLGVALRQLGQADQAAAEFAEAERSSQQHTDSLRERLAHYLADDPGAGDAPASLVPSGDASLRDLAPDARQALAAHVTVSLAQAYFNLGVLHVQAQHFDRAAEMFETVEQLSPSFPQGRYALGLAYFNAHRYDRAHPLLAAAVADHPGDTSVRRMAALAAFNIEAYAEAAALLDSDPTRGDDASVQYMYGVALVRSGRAADAERLFGDLLARHADAPEILVVMGLAEAQQGDLEAATSSLTKAIALKPDVAEANAALGLIYLKQGRLPEAEAALRAERASHPDNLQAGQTLATVLDLRGQRVEAVALLRAVLAARPGFVNARYLLGKVLLALGQTAEATTELEHAAQLAPSDANIHYQLGQAYQRAGQSARAEEQFELFRQLKDRRQP